jgi:hypothetical protein
MRDTLLNASSVMVVLGAFGVPAFYVISQIQGQPQYMAAASFALLCSGLLIQKVLKVEPAPDRHSRKP